MTWFRIKHFVCLLGMAGLAWPVASWSDTRPLPRAQGETISAYTKVKTQVQMKSEVVTMHLSPAMNHIEAWFEMVNHGLPVTLSVGFPVYYEHDMKGLVVTENDTVVPTNLKTDVDPRNPRIPVYWHLWESHFDKGETKKVCVTYDAYPEKARGSKFYREPRNYGFPLDEIVTGYALQTGAEWYSVIERADIRILLDGLTTDHLRYVHPQGAVVEGNSLRWILERIEPQEDVVISFNPALTLQQEIEQVRQQVRGTVQRKRFRPLTRLADLYQLAGQREEYIQTLESLVAFHPLGGRMRDELASLFLDNYARIVGSYLELIAVMEETGNGERVRAKGSEAAALFQRLEQNEIYYIEPDTGEKGYPYHVLDSKTRAKMKDIIRKYGQGN